MMLSRRSLLMAGAGMLASASSTEAVNFLPLPACMKEPTPLLFVKPTHTASLRKMLNDAMLGGTRTINMTRIDGFTVNGGDVVFWGRNEHPKRELLELDDLIVSIRAIYGMYGDGSHPAISLDSKAGAQQVRNGLVFMRANDDKGFEAKKRATEKYCKEYTGFSRVNDLPGDARVTKILLVADSNINNASDGRLPLNIKNQFPTLKSRIDAINDREHRTLNWNDRRANYDPTLAGRWWFEPGKMHYIVDGNTAFLDIVQIRLRNEPQRTTGEKREGSNIEAKVHADTFKTEWDRLRSQASEEWACDFSNRMDEIVASGQPWRAMGDVFRHFALARTLKETNALAGINQDLLFNTYKPASIDIPIQYPSVMTVKSGQTVMYSKRRSAPTLPHAS